MDVPGSETHERHERDTTADDVCSLFTSFLSTWGASDSEKQNNGGGGDPANADGQQTNPTGTYVAELARMRVEDRSTLYVDFAHVVEFSAALADIISSDYHRLEPALRRAVLAVAKAQLMARGEPLGDLAENALWIGFYNVGSAVRLRELKAAKVGQLTCLSATVTRTTEVRPELLWGTFQCMDCLTEAADVEQQFRFTEPTKCRNAACMNTKRWLLRVEKSVFADWQKCHVQENSWEIPSGSMPRTIDVVLRNEDVELAKAGDKCLFTGTLLVVPDVSKLGASASHGVTSHRNGGGGGGGGTSSASIGQNDGDGVSGLKELGSRQLTYRFCFLACCVQPLDSRGLRAAAEVAGGDDGDEEGQQEDAFTDEERAAVKAMRVQPDIYQRMVRSVAPAIFGHEDIKRGVLLMMFGGVHKTTMEGINLRGDINVCIVGDPSTAKSQFLKYVCSFYPRAVFTSGKASTAAGLTASVVKDDDTGEFNIEAGALMLADNGICCIDEFDKMDAANQVAIHEAMEQQTISIAKAGIHACLNARTSVLAAANPIGGRYERTKSLRSNLNIGAPLMSRFDLFFIVLDDCDEVIDKEIAEHIVNTHQHLDDALHPPFSPDQLRLYIRYAKSLKPVIPPESLKLFAEHYRRLRSNDVTGNRTSYRITVRQLESMIRLAEGLARLYLDPVVQREYVDEAARLLHKSIIRIQSDDTPLSDANAPAANLDHLDVGLSQTQSQSQSQTQPGGDSQVLSIPTEKYQQMTRSILAHLRSDPAVAESGLTVGEIVGWYVKAQQERFSSVEELRQESTLVRRVIDNLVRRDHVLVALGHAAPASMSLGDSYGAADDPDTLIVRPSPTVR